MRCPLPAGFSVALDTRTTLVDAQTLLGGSPPRVLRLTPAGQQAWAELAQGPAHSAGARVLGRQLTDAGVAHPRPPAAPVLPAVTVIIPVRDRAQMLRRCLASLPPRYPTIVVDDGSADPAEIAAAGKDFGATVIRRERGGPAAARNTGVEAVGTELIAFLDSDCVCADDWIEPLAAYFADPLVAAVAPRIVAMASSTSAGRFASSLGALDMGDRECRVMPGTAVAYVPTAALLVRRAVLQEIGAFDERLRYGEDVDLIWRIHEAGKLIRYQPEVRVMHSEPEHWAGLLARRFRYGTSAAPLGRRHPSAIAPLVLHPWPTAVLLCLMARRPAPAALIAMLSVLPATGRRRRCGLPRSAVIRLAFDGIAQTWFAIGRYCTQFAGPVLVPAVFAGRGPRRHRRTVIAALLLAAPLRALFSGAAQPDPIRFLAGHLAANISYGAGVWAGCLRQRTLIAVRPAVIRPPWCALPRLLTIHRRVRRKGHRP
ncbi:mycofactocin biosynthesis glycosyltransferase MftF [Mycobacterium sp. SM1]|uniref:mycofactocin biosynthesis glycosyltransferase MftF n=1 Tax=Mycobacterium sp. SM1 TaxID=2816243 RepID=UPI001BCB4411|nr:mycofactocin biosynthesis glycosyltransferase MftF [Mycobacterium sp. SM1]MBS4727928.1 mycofactocin biosynthesis glycosyltransferase MftF [Mycobacterium sp. SM1]